MAFKLLLPVLLLLQQQAESAFEMNFIMACAQETKADFMAVNQYFTSMNFDRLQPNEKCFVKCMMLKRKSMSETGEITSKAMANLPPSLAKHYDGCKDVGDSTDLCEKANLFYKCVFDAQKSY